MKHLIARIEELQRSVQRHCRKGLKEYPTRTIFIDPLLEALGWEVRDPDDVELEYPTVDNKSVDYALKLNRKPVLLLEAKALGENLDDVKSITQVVGYASNDGIEWCILSDGIHYRVYRTREPVPAPDKLLYECSIAGEDNEGKSAEEVARQFWRFSKEEMARGTLDAIGEQIFTDGKVRKAIEKLFQDPPRGLLSLIKARTADSDLKPKQIAASLHRIWFSEPVTPPQPPPAPEGKTPGERRRDYGEEHHTRGKPQETLEIYRALDRFCLALDPGNIVRRFRKLYISYGSGKKVFCSICLYRISVKVGLKLSYHDLQEPPVFARDVTNIGHWGIGHLELNIDTREKLQEAQAIIRQSYERSK